MQVIGLNGMHAFPIWENVFIYEDRFLLTKSTQEQLNQTSWVIPVQELSEKLSKDAKFQNLIHVMGQGTMESSCCRNSEKSILSLPSSGNSVIKINTKWQAKRTK